MGGRAGRGVIAVEPAADTFGLLEENIALNGYQMNAVRAAAGDHCGSARFTADLDAGNSLAPDGRMKVDVEGFEIDVLRGAARALAECRIGLIQSSGTRHRSSPSGGTAAPSPSCWPATATGSSVQTQRGTSPQSATSASAPMSSLLQNRGKV